MFYKNIGLKTPKILLPNNEVDIKKWSVVACDQFTSQRDYWDDVKNIAGKSPSTLNIVFPEVFLNDNRDDEIIKSINENMSNYVKQGSLNELDEGFILVNRELSNKKYRKGLVVAIDLECYDFSKGSTSLIRATEGTILERIPPRVKIRKDAELELPHIMVLIDDPQKTVIEPLFDRTNEFEKKYDFNLMKDGGNIQGWHISDRSVLDSIANSLTKLIDDFNVKYPNVKNPLLYAMGDGNHSLATAKAIWEDLKNNNDFEDIKDNTARFALVELVNIHNDAMEFHPIHRVLFNANLDDFLSKFLKKLKKENSVTEIINFSNIVDAKLLLKEEIEKGKQAIIFVNKKNYKVLSIENSKFNLAVGTFQDFTDRYVEESSAEIDYIHGEDVVENLSKKDNNFGVILPNISKDDFFKTIVLDGVFPRKTFSMGEAKDKRYYVEARKIK